MRHASTFLAAMAATFAPLPSGAESACRAQPNSGLSRALLLEERGPNGV